MKKIIIAAAVAAATLSAPAVADSKSEAYTACKAEIRSVLGYETGVSLRKIRDRGEVMRVRLRVSQPGFDTQTVTCLYDDAVVAFETSDKQPLELAALNAGSSDTAIN